MPITPSAKTRDLVTQQLRDAGCVFAEDEANLLIAEAKTEAELSSMIEKRASGLPLEQILGWAEFCGQRVIVEPGVFVPRRRTEFLVQQAVKLARPEAVVVDLGCGSGALGLAVAAQVERAQLYATDVEPAAVACARRNLEPTRGKVYEGDLFEPLPVSLRGHVDLLLANMPYVPTDAIRLLPAEARVHEPRITLDGGRDGLELHRRVAAEAASWLAPSGHLLIEVSQRQMPAAVALFEHNNLAPQVVTSDELEATVIMGTRSA